METAWAFEQPTVRSGRRIKAGFHCHTTQSDGGLSPREMAELYAARGFHCLGITDHFVVTKVGLSREDFLCLSATENGGMPDIIGVGVEAPAPRELPLAERAAGLAAQGGFTIAAHPTYCGVLPDEYAACPDLMAMEIYNAYCDAAYANGYALELWDMVLGLGKRIWGVAGDDAHLNPRKRRYSDAGLGWVEIWADALAPEPVLRALKAGAFFSTQGPAFEELVVTESGVSLTCTPVREVRWRTFGHVGHVDYVTGTPITHAELPAWFRPNSFLRIELVDEAGKRAWSNPFFVRGYPG